MLYNLRIHSGAADIIIIHELVNDDHPITGGEIAVDIDVQDYHCFILPHGGQGSVTGHLVDGAGIVEIAVGIFPPLAVGTGRAPTAEPK